MQYLAKMIMGDMSFDLTLSTSEQNFKTNHEQALKLAKKLGVELYSLQPVDEGEPVVASYQLTELDQEFVLKLTEVTDESLREESWLREQIKIWHNDKPEATQCQFFAYYTLWLRALELRPKVEVIVDIVDGVLQVAKSNADIVFHAIQRDRYAAITDDQDALYDRMEHMKGVF